MNINFWPSVFASLCWVAMAMQATAQTDLNELQPGEFEAESLVPFYLPEARFMVTSWQPNGYCGVITVENLPREPWYVTARLDSDIVRFSGGSYYGVVNRPHNLVFSPKTAIGVSRIHEFHLCVEGWHRLEIHSVNFGKGLTYDPVAIGVVAEATRSNAIRASIEVANTEQELSRIERLVGHSLDVAMDRYTVIAVFMGQQGSSGYAVEIPKLVKVPGRPNRLEGKILWSMPAFNCFVLPAFTSPYQVIKISKTDWEPRFVVQKQVTQCESIEIPIPPDDPALK